METQTTTVERNKKKGTGSYEFIQCSTSVPEKGRCVHRPRPIQKQARPPEICPIGRGRGKTAPKTVVVDLLAILDDLMNHI